MSGPLCTPRSGSWAKSRAGRLSRRRRGGGGGIPPIPPVTPPPAPLPPPGRGTLGRGRPASPPPRGPAPKTHPFNNLLSTRRDRDLPNREPNSTLSSHLPTRLPQSTINKLSPSPQHVSLRHNDVSPNLFNQSEEAIPVRRRGRRWWLLLDGAIRWHGGGLRRRARGPLPGTLLLLFLDGGDQSPSSGEEAKTGTFSYTRTHTFSFRLGNHSPR